MNGFRYEIRQAVLPANVGGDLQRAFLKFHREHPGVWLKFAELALELIDRGIEHYSADAIMHVIRFHTALGDTSVDRAFKIANAHVAYYSRVWRDTYFEHASFFRYQNREAA